MIDPIVGVIVTASASIVSALFAWLAKKKAENVYVKVNGGVEKLHDEITKLRDDLVTAKTEVQSLKILLSNSLERRSKLELQPAVVADAVVSAVNAAKDAMAALHLDDAKPTDVK